MKKATTKNVSFLSTNGCENLSLCIVQIEPQYLAVSVAHKFSFTSDCLCGRGSRSKELDAAGALRRKSVLCKSFGFPADNFRTKIEMLLLLLQKGEKFGLQMFSLSRSVSDPN